MYRLVLKKPFTNIGSAGIGPEAHHIEKQIMLKVEQLHWDQPAQYVERGFFQQFSIACRSRCVLLQKVQVGPRTQDIVELGFQQVPTV
jgi:hypothetical protein